MDSSALDLSFGMDTEVDWQALVARGVQAECLGGTWRRMWRLLTTYISEIDRFVPCKLDFEIIFSDWAVVKAKKALTATLKA